MLSRVLVTPCDHALDGGVDNLLTNICKNTMDNNLIKEILEFLMIFFGCFFLILICFAAICLSDLMRNVKKLSPETLEKVLPKDALSCPKCGSLNITSRYIPGIINDITDELKWEPEYLSQKCMRCEYKWKENTLEGKSFKGEA